MNPSSPTSKTLESCQGSTPAQPRKGLIVFCEKNLRYEGGLKAWVFLGPYFVGAFVLEILIEANPAHAKEALGPWIGFLAYLILFPAIWRRVLRFVPTAPGKNDSTLSGSSSRQ